MQHRPTFLILALYAPTDDAGARRKLKSIACQKRLLFISYNIEEFGYYGFLELFENGAHDHLMWLGSKAAKHSTGAKKAKSRDDAADPPQDELAQLLRHDPSHYDRVIERVLDHTRVDEEGYASIRELEQSNALDSSRPAHLRLSTNALARIALDVSTKDPPNPNWVGNRSTGPWKKLLSDITLRSVQAKLDKRLSKGKSVVTYDHKKFKASEQCEDDSDFEDDGEPVILPRRLPLPSPPAPSPSSKTIPASPTAATKKTKMKNFLPRVSPAARRTPPATAQATTSPTRTRPTEATTSPTLRREAPTRRPAARAMAALRRPPAATSMTTRLRPTTRRARTPSEDPKGRAARTFLIFLFLFLSTVAKHNKV
ncbi:hypothetical protein PF007_g12833 [Phytophthora fragariae]|uniref:Uncharacterized protein n=2 Tax=Phytophthora fragariae TaxID=53985 RepID=A0A6A3FA18_9STRA|nr:hypothetical protein PF009_g9509 [Phytophthora fragariae]KAE9107968.1 hypothetical protein PF007_g12833 [Phytophthora fragariae]KAE9146850.1 hypothetical protein PF006_g8416 [Phytophthora fragariae]KAE9272956.1 hypothetical protein PF001_g27720 [Phytophthora fragariae]